VIPQPHLFFKFQRGETEMETPTPQFTPVEAPKKSNTPLIIGIVVVVLLCCCCLIVGGGLLLFMGNSVGGVYSSINEQLTAMPEIPSMPAGTVEPSNPSDTPSNPSIPSDLIPQGGLGDDTQRATAWGKVIISAVMSGCNASDASKTTIDVLQQPDSAGVWKEKWTVTCDNGENKSYDVSFTPGAQGVTDIDVTESK
jgi:hypothetical protein